GFPRVAIQFALSGDTKTKRLCIPGPEPIEAIAIDHKVREENVAERAAKRALKRKSAIHVVEECIDDANIAHTRDVAFAEFYPCRSGREPAIGDDDIFADQRRSKPVLRNKGNAIVPCLDVAIRDRHILAAIQVNAIGPDGFLEAAIDIEAVERGMIATIES